MMHYITPKEMVEIRLVLHLKDRMTRRVCKKTPTERKYTLCGCFHLYIKQVLLMKRIYDMRRDVLGLRIR